MSDLYSQEIIPVAEDLAFSSVGRIIATILSYNSSTDSITVSGHSGISYIKDLDSCLVWNSRTQQYEEGVALIINTTPSSATVTITVNGQSQNTNYIILPVGTTVSYSVSNVGYKTTTGTITVNSSTTLNISLEVIMHTLTISPTPNDATVTLTAAGYTQVGNSITVPYGTSVSYSVSKSGYITQTGQQIVTSTNTLSVTLSVAVTLTISPTPNNSTVTLIAAGYTQVGNSITVPYGTSVLWVVEHENLSSLASEVTVNNTQTVSVILLATYTINPNPYDATVTLTSPGRTQSGNSITVPYGSTITYTVSANNCISQTGTLVATENRTDEIILKYETDTVIFESNSPGTYTLNIDTSRGNTYQIDVVGGGGCGYTYKPVNDSSYVYIRGGSGAYVKIEVPNTEPAKTNANGQWTLTVGSGGANISNEGSSSSISISSIGNICTSGNGQNSKMAKFAVNGGTYTTKSDVGFIFTGTNGNIGGYTTGMYGSSISNTPSPYDTQHSLGATYGYGGGVNRGNFIPGGNGYIKVTVTG